MVCCRCCFCCCSACKKAVELSQQEIQHQQDLRHQRQRQQQAYQPQQPLRSQQQPHAPRQPQQQQPQAPLRTQSWRSRLSMSSHGSDLPPPYEEGVAGSQSRAPPPPPQNQPAQHTKLPYAIPLASFMDDTALLNTISKVHAADFSEHGISQEQFQLFYYELDKRLSHQTDGQPGMLNNVMTILRDNNDPAQAGAGGDPKIDSFIDLSNQDMFHPAALHVEVLGSDATKHKVKLSPELEEDREKTMTKLAKVEEKIAKLDRKFNEELAKSTDDHERDQIQAEYDAKRSKLRLKASQVLADYNQRSDAELFDGLKPSVSAGQEGPLWLVVSARP